VAGLRSKFLDGNLGAVSEVCGGEASSRGWWAKRPAPSTIQSPTSRIKITTRFIS
jgi:hypothetical protein